MAFWNNDDERRRREDIENRGGHRNYDYSLNNNFDASYDDSRSDRRYGRDSRDYQMGGRLSELPPLERNGLDSLPPIQQSGRYYTPIRPQDAQQVNTQRFQAQNASQGAPQAASQGIPNAARQQAPHQAGQMASQNLSGSNVVIYSPETYNDVQTLIDYLKRREPVIIDFSKINNDSAQRVLDFMSGAIYALGGSMQRIKQTIFLLTPAGVSISVPVDQIRKNSEGKK